MFLTVLHGYLSNLLLPYLILNSSLVGGEQTGHKQPLVRTAAMGPWEMVWQNYCKEA